MTHVHTLTHHHDIQAWAADRNGMPAIVPTVDKLGQPHTKLALKFGGPDKPEGMPGVDNGASPVSWDAWLAELDRQQLALRVSGDDPTAYELIERKSLN